MKYELVLGRVRSGLTCAAAVLLGGCGSGGSQGNGGQVTDAWRDYCIATFTSDVAIKDSFGDIAFTVHNGERFLLTRFDTQDSQPQVEIGYLTSLGLETYLVPVTGSGALPFTSNCTIDSADEYYAAFTDVTVYATQDLGTKLCQITAGTSLPRGTTQLAGASAVTLSLSGPQVYDIMLNAFSAACNNATDGYVSVPQTQVLGVTTWLIPIAVILKPR